jgi:hypothetical protein
MSGYSLLDKDGERAQISGSGGDVGELGDVIAYLAGERAGELGYTLEDHGPEDYRVVARGRTVYGGTADDVLRFLSHEQKRRGAAFVDTPLTRN